MGDVVIQTDSPEDARRQVDTLAAQHVDAIKIWVDDLGGTAPKIKPAVIDAIVDEARKYNIPVTAHIYSIADTKHMVQAGASGFWGGADAADAGGRVGLGEQAEVGDGAIGGLVPEMDCGGSQVAAVEVGVAPPSSLRGCYCGSSIKVAHRF